MQPAMPVQHADRAVLLAHGHGPGKEGAHLVRRGGCGDVEIGLLLAEQRIAKRATYTPRLIPRGDERLDDLQHLRRDVHVGRHPSAIVMRRLRRSRPRTAR